MSETATPRIKPDPMDLIGAHVCLWDWDVSSGTLSWSVHFRKVLGIEDPDFTPCFADFEDRLHPDDRADVLAAIDAHVDEGAPYDVEMRMRRDDGTYVWIRAQGDSMRDEDGKALRVMGAAHDITRSKRREVESRALMEASYDGFWDWYPQDDYEYMSPRFWEIFGFEPHEKRHHPSEWQKLIFPEDLPGTLENFRKHVETKGEHPFSQEVRYRHKDGSTVTVLCRGRVVEWDADGQPVRIIGTHTDISDIREAEQALTQSENRFATAVDGLSVGLWDWVDVDTETEWWSPKFFELIGYAPGEITPSLSAFRDLLHPDDQETAFAAVEDHFAKRIPVFQIEYRLKHKTKGYRWFLGTGKAIWDETGRPLRMIGSILDVHERREAENLKSEFVSNVSHELRTPLTSIMGALDLVRSGRMGIVPDKADRLLGIAQVNGRRLVALINDILDLEKIERGKLTFSLDPFSLHKLLTSAKEEAAVFAAQQGVTIDMALTSEDALVCVDPVRFAQVMDNLMSNAIKFSGRGTTVRISVTRTDKQVRVAVADEGPGIPEAFRPHVFEKFTQADGSDTRALGGTGLGLSIAKSLVEIFGGAIGFEPGPTRGTVFFFTLPIWQDKATNGRGSFLFDPDSSQPRILFVEDDADAVAVTRQILEDQGEIRVVPTQREALAAARAERPDVIILDLNLSDGYALELIKDLLDAAGSQARLIVYSVDDVPVEKLPDGVTSFVKTQIGPDVLRKKVATLLQKDRLRA